ncbi:MAG: HAD family phosphatase [Lentisphaeria bacterium]|nr:HAD family phosphatase [Lentisphaeria bacterium]
MIRLVATDMDGTLLNSAGELPPVYREAIRLLGEHGVLFAVASGRQYYNLLNYFGDFRDTIVILCENGARVSYRGEEIFLDKIPDADLAGPAGFIRSIPGADPVLCGARAALIERDEPLLVENTVKYYERYEIVPDVLEAAKSDRICKIAVFDKRGAENNSYRLLQKFRERFTVLLSGECWADLMNPGVDKGLGLSKIQAHFGISPQETMAFGDYLNDCAMMEHAFYSYAVSNAHPGLKKLCRFETASNDENGVLAALKKHFSFL